MEGDGKHGIIWYAVYVFVLHRSPQTSSPQQLLPHSTGRAGITTLKMSPEAPVLRAFGDTPPLRPQIELEASGLALHRQGHNLLVERAEYRAPSLRLGGDGRGSPPDFVGKHGKMFILAGTHHRCAKKW
jgi:hypothetical protein